MTKVLYVEDEPFLGKIVKESLESRDFEVTMVTDGRDAFERFKQVQPDICVLDVMLPNVDGFTIGKQIRARPSNVPIIYLTAKDQTDDLLNGFRSGGNDYIKKPFSMEELIARMQNLLALAGHQGQAPAKAQVYQLGNYAFYPHLMELQFAGEIRKLSYRENELLKILVTGHKESIDRRYIMKQIWGDDGFFNSRNLDVYIRKLRSYLSRDEQVQIITLKGVGYRFIY